MQLVDIVKAMIRPKRITVLGSSSLLASHPNLGEKGMPLELSLDADLLVEPCDAGQAGVLHEAIGEGSLFHREFGIYADFMRPGIMETLPAGWQNRCVWLERDRDVRCLNPVDLAVVKLQLGREKDIALLRSLIKTSVIRLPDLRKAYQKAAMDERTMFKAGRLLGRLESEIQAENEDSPANRPTVREAQAEYGRTERRQRTGKRKAGTSARRRSPQPPP
jgi:hypothetical protein